MRSVVRGTSVLCLTLYFTAASTLQLRAEVGQLGSSKDVLAATVAWGLPHKSMAVCQLLVDATEPVAVLRIRGSGAGITGTKDAGFFAYAHGSGNCRIQAHLRLTGPLTQDWAKAGLTIRDTPYLPNSANAFGGIRGRLRGDLLFAQTRSAGNEETVRWRGYMQDREGKNTIAEEQGGVWLRLSRYAGAVFDGRADLYEFEYSWDAAHWTLFSRQVAELTDPVAVGVAVDSAETGGNRVEVLVSGLTISEATPAPAVPVWLAESPQGTARAVIREDSR